MDNTFTTYNLINKGEGYEEATDFFDKLVNKTIDYLRNYYRSEGEYGFDFGEEQVKTYVTLALGEICNGIVIQKYPFDKKSITERKKFIKSNGLFDYWANYQKSDFIIEVKHGEVRYTPEKQQVSFRNYVAERFESAVIQINNIKNKSNSSSTKQLFGLSLLIAPLYVRPLTKSTRPIIINSDFGDMLEEIRIKNKANLLGFWFLDEKDQEVFEYYDANKKIYYQTYPGVLFLGKIVKFSMDKRNLS